MAASHFAREASPIRLMMEILHHLVFTDTYDCICILCYKNSYAVGI